MKQVLWWVLLLGGGQGYSDDIQAPLASTSEKRSLTRGIEETAGSCDLGDVREYSQTDLSLREQKKLAETLLRLSWVIFSDCDGQPSRDEQQMIYSVCTGDSTKLMVNVQYLCGNE